MQTIGVLIELFLVLQIPVVLECWHMLLCHLENSKVLDHSDIPLVVFYFMKSPVKLFVVIFSPAYVVEAWKGLPG